MFDADGGLNPSFSKRPYFYYDDYDADAGPQAFLRVCPKTSGGITKFSEHEAD